MTSALIRMLCQEVGLPASDIERIVSSAPRRYKEFRIKKKNGKGYREIAQPSRELKALQRIVVAKAVNGLPVHACAHAYVSGKSIKTNAQAHRGSRFMLKMDFSNFFPSIRPIDFRAHLKKFLPGQFDADEGAELERILFWRKKGQRTLKMCIGAPSSPFISNTIMFDLDSKIHDACVGLGVIYTRYADDLTFSCSKKGVLSDVQALVETLVSESKRPKIRINKEKTVHLSMRQRRAVTGVNVTPSGQLSIGRDRKRLIRAMANHHLLGKLDAEGRDELIGLLGFANDIEPDFARKVWRALQDAAPLVPSNRKPHRA